MDKDKLKDTILDNELQLIEHEKESAYNYRERRHDQWRENYTLSRDRIQTNRLTQRQSINVPLMKYGLATILKDIDEASLVTFSSLSNNEEKEILFNEAWNEFWKRNKGKLKDRASKKHLGLYGRYFKKLNIVNGKAVFDVVLPENILVDRYLDPLDLDSARILIHINIFESLTNILANEDFDQDARNSLSQYFATDGRQVESATNVDRMNNMNDKMADMGVTDTESPVVGTTIVELNEVYRKEYNATLQEEEIIVYVVAATSNGLYKLSKKPLEDVLGETKENAWRYHFPYTTGSADPEADDFWNDGPGDTIRQSNKLTNSMASSMAENRILRNFNMHYYNSSNASFVPQVFQPTPWAWFPVPGDPNETIKDVTVGDLSESLDEMQFFIGISEKAIGATSVQTGELPPSQVKLGQTEIAVANARDRIGLIGLGILQENEDFAQKFIWLIEGAKNLLDEVTIHKKGREGKRIWSKTIKPSDYWDETGFVAEVRMREDKDQQEVTTIQKLRAAKEEMPMNLPLQNIIKKKLLDFADLKAEEAKEVMDFEKNNSNNMNMMGVMPGANPNMMATQNIPNLPNGGMMQ